MLKKKMLALVLPLLAVGILAGAYTQSPHASEVGASDSVTHTGTVYLYKNGELVAETHNVLMEGENAIRAQLQSGSAVSWDQITLGNGTAPSIGATTLDSEWASCGLSPATGTFTNGTAGVWNLTAAFDCTCDNVTVNTTAQYSSGAGASIDYWSGTSFGRNINLYSGDSLEVVWQNDVNSA